MRSSTLETALVLLACLVVATASGCRASQEPSHGTDESRRRALEALPYASWTDINEDSASGVVVHDIDRASPGLNLYVSLARTSAILMDMSGTVLHRWSRDSGREWGHVELLPNRELLVLNEEPRKIMRLH